MDVPQNMNSDTDTAVAAAAADIASSSQVLRSVSSSAMTCWVCFATDEDDRLAQWLTPCRCKGSMKYVHMTCLEKWIDEKQKGNIFSPVQCTHCNTKYIIVYPALNRLTVGLAHFNSYVNRMAPFMAGGMLLGGLYWVAVTYGAITCMQFCGYRRAMHMFGEVEPMVLLVTLPTLPIALMSASMINWDDQLAYKMYLRSAAARKARKADLPLAAPPTRRMHDGNDSVRLVCTSLSLPTISVLIGKWLIGQIYPEWTTVKRNVCGALAYLSIKGICNIYYRYNQLCQRHDRQVLNFPEESTQGTQTMLDVNIQEEGGEGEDEVDGAGV